MGGSVVYLRQWMSGSVVVEVDDVRCLSIRDSILRDNIWAFKARPPPERRWTFFWSIYESRWTVLWQSVSLVDFESDRNVGWYDVFVLHRATIN